MDEDIRTKKEDIIKNKLENEEVDLSALSDDEINKVVTPEAEKEAISQATEVENLDSLSDEDIDKLFGSIESKKGEGLAEALEWIINVLEEKKQSKEKITNLLCTRMNFKESEANDLYELCKPKEYFINKTYEIFKECEERPEIYGVMNLKEWSEWKEDFKKGRLLQTSPESREVVRKIKGFAALPYINPSIEKERLKLMQDLKEGDVIIVRDNNPYYMIYEVFYKEGSNKWRFIRGIYDYDTHYWESVSENREMDDEGAGGRLYDSLDPNGYLGTNDYLRLESDTPEILAPPADINPFKKRNFFKI